jgi:hypothetical protein
MAFGASSKFSFGQSAQMQQPHIFLLQIWHFASLNFFLARDIAKPYAGQTTHPSTHDLAFLTAQLAALLRQQ